MLDPWPFISINFLYIICKYYCWLHDRLMRFRVGNCTIYPYKIIHIPSWRNKAVPERRRSSLTSSSAPAPLYPWWEVHNDDHSHITFDNFLSRYKMIFESCFRMKSLYSPNKKNLGKKWITQGMRISSATKRVFYKIAPQ